ncbi:MAG: hypothetical protein ACR2FM_04125 [Candidatus Saccharimonadales bacterium]
MDQLYKEIVSFQHRCKDDMDDRSHPIGRSLEKEVQRLEDEAQAQKNPHSIEDQVQVVMRLLHQAGDNNVMSHNHADELIRQCEDFRKKLQKLA